jgi:hypothetical protein
MKIGDVPSIVNDGDRYVFGKVLEKGGIVCLCTFRLSSHVFLMVTDFRRFSDRCINL